MEPFEIEMTSQAKYKKRVASKPIDLEIVHSWHEFISKQEQIGLILNGNSANLQIPSNVVDAVITDPPYFDFIHYSELSDFFFAWLSPLLKTKYTYFDQTDTHNSEEVQHKDHKIFSYNLTKVFVECYRILKNDGVMIFSFHHSKIDGWISIYTALRTSCFSVVAIYPIYAEMKGSATKANTKIPISIDIILVCRKEIYAKFTFEGDQKGFIQELSNVGISLSDMDIFNIKIGFLVIKACQYGWTSETLKENILKLQN